jgi:Diguanylate cyclase, GGDEF domain
LDLPGLLRLVHAEDHVIVSEAIAESIRAHDFAARIGGDEFAAILPVAGQALHQAKSGGRNQASCVLRITPPDSRIIPTPTA